MDNSEVAERTSSWSRSICSHIGTPCSGALIATQLGDASGIRALIELLSCLV